MVRFIGAMLVLVFLVGGLNYLIQEKPWQAAVVAQASEEPQAPTPTLPPAPKPEPKPVVTWQPVTRDVLRYDCSGRPYVCRITEYVRVSASQCR